jgi:outer membrane autotransporter protein
MGADVDGSGRYQMAFSASLSGLRNRAVEREGAAQFANPERAFMEGWDIWLAAEVSGVRDDRAGEDASSDFAIAQLGVDYQLSDTLIVGALAQYDWMSETTAEVFEAAGGVAGARLNGEGWMAGPYAVWRLHDQLIFDALALYGQSDNQVDPLGLYEDDFETDRFMLRANLTGEFRSGPWRLRPQAGVTHFEETQKAYSDRLGIVIPEQTVAIGRLRAGPELAWRQSDPAGGWLEVTTALTAVWDYQAADLLSETGQLTAGEDALRADARIGVSTLTRWGALVGLETGYAGLGQGDFEARSLRFDIRIPFGAAGAGAGAMGGFAGAGGLLGADCSTVHAGFEQAAMGQSACQGGPP